MTVRRPTSVVLFALLLWLLSAGTRAAEPDAGLLGHWRLLDDCKDSSGQENHGLNHGVTFDAVGGATFDGIADYVEVPDSESLNLGTGDFSIAVWIHTEAVLDDVLGDILSKFDPAARTGINFSVMNYVGATSAQSNHRNLFFGIDAETPPRKWADCGRPGKSRMIWALSAYEGDLYAGTWEPGAGDAGHVYRYQGGAEWNDCGSPDLSNTVSALGEHDGKLYCGTSFYSGKGSAQPVSPNKNPGGRVFRYEGGTQWTDCGKIGEVYTVTGLVTYDGNLYATTCDSYGCPTRTAACYRYEGNKKWTFVGDPGGRLGAFLVYNRSLYATVFGKQSFARYEGNAKWTPLGTAPGTGQTYSAVVHQGRICVGTWPDGTVFRFDGPDKFTSLGRLGVEKEVMAMAVYNGKLYGGTLPLGEVYRYDGVRGWTSTGQLDTTPDVLYRRVWSMAVHDGKLFAGTLPSGRVLSLEAGRCASDSRALAPGWRHVAAVRQGGRLRLYVDAKCVAESSSFESAEYDLSNTRPLRIGFGEHDYFNGRMKELRIYGRALSEDQLRALFELPVASAAAKDDTWQASAENPPAVTHDKDPAAPVAFAAAELRRYLGQILGTPIPETPSGDAQPVIHLAVEPGGDSTNEAYQLRAEGDTFHITGQSPLAVLYGAYEFLRRHGGCRFADLGPDGEFVPEKKRIEAPAGLLRMEPRLAYRGLQFSFYEDPELACQRIDWMAKNGMNYLMYRPAPEHLPPESVVTVDPATGDVKKPGVCNVYWWFSKSWFDKVLRPEVRKRGLKLDMNHHNFLYWLPQGRYFADHPEWYSLVDGKRGGRFSQMCICTSNSQAVATLIENIRKYLRENREVKVVGVIPQDHMAMCQCDQCVAGDPNPKDAFEKTTWETGNRSKVFRYARLLNAVAAAIRDEFPDVYVGGEAYHDLLWPSKDVPLDRRTVVWLAVHMRDGCRPIREEGQSTANNKIHQILTQWKQVYQGRLILYEYYMGMNAQRSLPYPMSEVICEDWTHLKKLGVDGATVQCWTSNHSTYVLNNLAFARCGWYDQVDHAEIMDDYLLGAYGSVGEQVRPIFEGLIQATRDLAAGESVMRPSAGNVRYFLDEVGRDRIRRCLAQARQEVTNEREGRQIEKLAAAVRYWELATDTFNWYNKAASLRKSDSQEALRILDELLDQKWPELLKYNDPASAPGWVCITVPSIWEHTRRSAETLREEIRKRPTAPEGS